MSGLHVVRWPVSAPRAAPPRPGLIAALTSLTRTANGEFTVEALLADVCALAMDALGVDGAGVLIARGDDLHFVHAEPAALDDLERLQEGPPGPRVGPGSESAETRGPVAVSDIAGDARWPRFRAAAAAAGVAAVLAVPLLARGTVFGVLDLHDAQVRDWTADDLEVARMFADVATSYLVMATDRDALLHRQQVFEHLATHDGLTGLPNRTLLVDRLEHAVASTGRHETALAVLFIDLDRFKEINDTLGHAAGDRVLTEAARRLTRVLRGGDTLARYGGDEFVIVCEDFADSGTDLSAQLATVAERVNAALGEPPITYRGADLDVTASIGAALTNRRGTTADELLAAADTAMYAAKERGPGQFALYDRAVGPGAMTRVFLERDLRQAGPNGELRLHFQPIVSTGTGNPVVAVEALLRWQHPTRGLLPAESFIDLAERTGLIEGIGAWVIDQACAQARRWRDAGGDLADAQMFVNLSPRELASPGLSRTVAAALERHQVPAAQLGLEIIEGFFSEPLLINRLEVYRDSGHPLAIDDFGIGYSSLSRLVDLAVGHAKIDRSITARITSDIRRLRLVHAIVMVAHQLGLIVTAEGVESQAQADLLTTAGCDRLQGYCFGHPQAGEGFAGARAARPVSGLQSAVNGGDMRPHGAGRGDRQHALPARSSWF